MNTLKKLLGLGLLMYVVPSVAFAAWWNPISWFQKAPVPVAGLSASMVQPSVADLQSEIAQLEAQLQAAQAQLASTTKSAAPKAAVAAAPAVTAPAVSSTASDSSVMSLVTPSVVLVQTATSSGAGVFIDSSGDVLTSAHLLLVKDSSGNVSGYANAVSVTLSNGATKSAQVVGIDQDTDTAIVQLTSKSSSSYLKPGAVSATAGNRAYVLSYPVSQSDPSGYGFVPATVSEVATASYQATVDEKPVDNGGALVDSHGGFMGVPHVSSCKILEEGTDCLTYVVTAKTVPELPQLLAGMILYTVNENPTAEESSVLGAIQTMYQSLAQASAVDYAISNVTGDNSFDDFNSRLSDDTDGKITKIYLNKLKLSADSAYQAADFLKTQADNLNVFLEEEQNTRSALNPYERAIVNQMQATNAAKEAEYVQKVAYWSAKRNEYDAKLADPSSASHDYLLEESVTAESAADYFTAEKQRILAAFSGQTAQLF